MRQIETMTQVVRDERDREKRKQHAQVLKELLEEQGDLAGIRPGVMERQRLRDEMSAGMTSPL